MQRNPTRPSTQFTRVYFHSRNAGWVVGSGGTILRTINGGDDWYQLVSRTDHYLRAVAFRDSLTGFAGGSQGTLFYTIDGGGPVNVTPPPPSGRKVTRLRQNYPNPYLVSRGGVAVIEFEVPVAGRISMDMYDILGRKVATLLDADLPATTPGVTHFPPVYFDGRELASGVYFYRIQGPEYTEVRKMVILR
jgi:hypothetical protein